MTNYERSSKRSTSHVNCSVPGCNYTYGNSPPGTRFYSFPNAACHSIRREAWIRSLKRETVDGKPWTPTKNSRICSRHFVNGVPTRDPGSPGYQPTLDMLPRQYNVVVWNFAKYKSDVLPTTNKNIMTEMCFKRDHSVGDDHVQIQNSICGYQTVEKNENSLLEIAGNVPLPVTVLIKEEVDLEENEDIYTNDKDVQLPVNVIIKEEMDVQEDEEDSITDAEAVVERAASSSVHRVTKQEQRACIKFCVNLQKSASETSDMLREAFGDQCMSRAQCYRWHKLFLTGRTTLEDAKRSGRPRVNKQNVPKIQSIVSEDRSLSFREMSKITGLNLQTCVRFSETELQLRRICGKLVPRSLTQEEKEERVSVCFSLQTAVMGDPTFISRIISCGESWFYGCQGGSKCKNCRSSNSGVRWPKKPQGKLPSRSLLIVFFDVKGIVHWEFSPCTEALDAEEYCEVLSRLRGAIERKRPTLWRANNWVLHHDNSPAHNARATRQFLAANCVTVVPHPQSSCAPDLTPWDLGFMEGLKMRMKARAIKIPHKFRAAIEKDLCKLKVKDFQNTFRFLQGNWELCINSHGEYCNVEQE